MLASAGIDPRRSPTIHFPEKFHLEAWRALTAESAQREIGLPARPIMLAQQRYDDLPPDVKAALRG